MALQISADGKIDRQITVPFHLKLFYRNNSHHRPDEFAVQSTHQLPSHLQIYTWPSCTIRELSHLLTSALPSLLPNPYIGTRLSFRLVFPDTRDTRPGPGRYLMKELGTIVIGGDGPGVYPPEDDVVVTNGPMAGRLDGDPEKTLQDARFVIGDYVSCAILPPGPNGEPVPPPSGLGRGDRGGYGGSYGRGRENGFGRGFGGRGGGFRSGPSYGRLGEPDIPSGEWRRGERLPDGPPGRSYRGGRGRGW